MSKRNITYIKPEEPSFLKKIKQQVGYKEGPTVDTKREDLGPVRDEDLVETQEEQPTIVVLEPGDLTAEEVSAEKSKLEKEASEKAADLNLPIVFKARDKSKKSEKSESSKRLSADSEDKKKAKKVKNNKTLLSFNEEENDD